MPEQIILTSGGSQEGPDQLRQFKLVSTMQAEKLPLKPRVCFSQKTLASNQCLHTLWGNKVDFTWHIQQAMMEVNTSKAQKFQHLMEEHKEHFKAIPVKHRAHCPLLEQKILKNENARVAPCVVVLIQNKNTGKILATQRHQRMSFGNKWVLPGGHLEPGQTVFAGGLRECQEEVGLRPEVIIPCQDPKVMIWESVLTDKQEQRVKKIALVIFFRIQCEDFDVVEQKSEVKQWQWRQFKADQNPWGDGWAQGHLRYLEWVSETK